MRGVVGTLRSVSLVRALISSKIDSDSSDEVRRLRFGVGVLGLQVADDLWIVLVPQPLVRVDERIPVMDARDRQPFRNGGWGRIGGVRVHGGRA